MVNELRQSIENAVARSYGLPETGPEYHDGTTVHGALSRWVRYCDESATRRSDVIENVRELEKLAGKNGIKIGFEKSGDHVKTETIAREAENNSYPTVITDHERHSYNITGYQSLYLLENVEGLKDTSSIESAIGDKKAEAAFCVLDELLKKYGPKPETELESEWETAAQQLLKEEHYALYKGQTERARRAKKQLETGKQQNAVRLFGLTDEKIYAGLGELAGEELEKRKTEIKKTSYSIMLPFARSCDINVALRSYEKTLEKIETLKAQFIVREN